MRQTSELSSHASDSFTAASPNRHVSSSPCAPSPPSWHGYPRLHRVTPSRCLLARRRRAASRAGACSRGGGARPPEQVRARAAAARGLPSRCVLEWRWRWPPNQVRARRRPPKQVRARAVAVVAGLFLSLSDAPSFCVGVVRLRERLYGGERSGGDKTQE
jgi:hypothetical protein